VTRAEYEQFFYSQQAAMSNSGVPSPIQQAALANAGTTSDSKPPVEQTNYSHVQHGTIVTHESFGKGTITKLVSTRMTVWDVSVAE